MVDTIILHLANSPNFPHLVPSQKSHVSEMSTLGLKITGGGSTIGDEAPLPDEKPAGGISIGGGGTRPRPLPMPPLPLLLLEVNPSAIRRQLSALGTDVRGRQPRGGGGGGG